VKSPICDMLGIEFPLLAFSHCRDVVVEVSKAGGMGVLGATGFTPEQLEVELAWVDEHVQGMPYGVDLMIPDNLGIDESKPPAPEELTAMVPEGHRDFVRQLLNQHEVDCSELYEGATLGLSTAGNLQKSGAAKLLDVCFDHPIKLIANALGVPPAIMLQRGKAHNVPVAALVGAKEHAIKQVQAGVDILVVAGGEAGGHCGDVTTMVLVPEVHEAIQAYGDVPILAAGGIVTGRQMAATMAMGAAGAWTGSVWLTTREANTNPAVKDKMLAASSRGTVRSKSRTGKFSRQLKSSWTEAWEADESPDPLPMPLQALVSEPALRKIDKLAESGHEGAKSLATYWVGQGVGMMNESTSVKNVVYQFKEDYLQATERLQSFLEE
jgi:NAD(P)H-dependent flavin oxidoreductase YrpB (nitropropane dioxygenase family)